MGAINPRFKAYEKFISVTYLSGITRYILFALVDATTKPILFGGKVTKRLTGRNTTCSMQRCPASSSSTDGSDLGDDALMDDAEKPAPATLWHLDAIQEIEQDYLGYAPGEVSLRDAAS